MHEIFFRITVFSTGALAVLLTVFALRPQGDAGTIPILSRSSFRGGGYAHDSQGQRVGDRHRVGFRAAERGHAGNRQPRAAGHTWDPQVSDNISSVGRAAGDTGRAAVEVLASANEFGKNGSALKDQVDAFLREVRAV
jgi:hypothetical protein